jgi:hypothetical protein
MPVYRCLQLYGKSHFTVSVKLLILGRRNHLPTLIDAPARIQAPGNKPKLIDEYVGRVNSAEPGLSVAPMRSPAGWEEPGQTQEFEEFTVVLRGALRVEPRGGVLVVQAGKPTRLVGENGFATALRRRTARNASGPVSRPSARTRFTATNESRLAGGAHCRSSSPEFITFDANGSLAEFGPYHLAGRDKFQQANSVEARGPVYRELHHAAERQLLLRSEKDSSASDIQGLTHAGDLCPPGVEQFIPDLLAKRKPARTSPLSR